MFQQTNTNTVQAELIALRAENARLKAQAPKPKAISAKVSLKGAVSVYGLGRFPVTLYKSQWARLLNEAQNIQAFITAHPELKEKGE